MKKIALIALSALFITACGGKKENNTADELSAENAFLLTITVDEASSNLVLVKKLIDNEYKTIDTIAIVDGIITYKEAFNGFSEIIFFKFDDIKKPLKVMTELGEVSIRVNPNDIYNTIAIESGVKNEQLTNFYQQKMEYDNALSQLEEKRKSTIIAGSNQDVEAVDKEYDNKYNEMVGFMTSYIFDEAPNEVGAHIADRHLYVLEADELQGIISSFEKSIEGSPFVQSLNKRLIIIKNVVVGAQAPDFTQNTPDGTPVSLHSLVGDNYLLIDFWAAWCGPCRAENPNLVALYNQYNDQGLDIVGVSFDRKKENWVKGIEEDGLSWTQISDLQGWKNEAGKLYGIRSIPQNLLLDPNGIIIAKNLYGNELAEKVKEVLAKKES